MMHNTVSLIKNHFSLLLSLFFLGLITACDDQASCISNNTNYIRVNFYKIDTTGDASVTDTYEGMSLYGADGSLLIENDTVNAFQVPLNPSADQSFFVLQQDSVFDTLYFAYDREQLVISPECGVEQRFYNLSVPQKTLDSVRVLETDISTTNIPQVAIYTCRYSLDDTLRLSFYQFDPNDTVPPLTSSRDTVNIISVTNDRGDVILQDADSVRSIKFPVYPNASQISLTFTYTELNDSTQTPQTGSVVFSYRETPDLLIPNTNCLPQTRYDQLDSVQLTGIDTVIFQNTTLDQNNTENARIFF